MARVLASGRIAIPVLGIVIVAMWALNANSGTVSSGGGKVADEEDVGDCCSSEVRYFKLQLDRDGKVSQDKSGFVKWVKTDAPQLEDKATSLSRSRRGHTATVTVECRTPPTDSHGRKSCDDEEVHNLPDGYVFVENEMEKHWNSDIGSENTCDVIWEDRVEVIPGTGITQATTMRVRGHARSGGGQGERGHTDCTVTCPFVGYTHE